MSFPPDVVDSAAKLVENLRVRRQTVTTAESCTGGLVAGAITSIAGSSDVFEAGYVTYSDAAKQRLLSVPQGILASHGAVSGETASAMALGAAQAARANFAISVTGIAGPGGATAEKRVGLVYIAVAAHGEIASLKRHEFGDIGRGEVRLASVREALAALLEAAA